MDVRNSDSITKAFKKVNLEYDIIFEYSTQLFEDQVRVVETAHHFLKKFLFNY